MSKTGVSSRPSTDVAALREPHRPARTGLGLVGAGASSASSSSAGRQRLLHGAQLGADSCTRISADHTFWISAGERRAERVELRRLSRTRSSWRGLLATRVEALGGAPEVPSSSATRWSASRPRSWAARVATRPTAAEAAARSAPPRGLELALQAEEILPSSSPPGGAAGVSRWRRGTRARVGAIAEDRAAESGWWCPRVPSRGGGRAPLSGGVGVDATIADVVDRPLPATSAARATTHTRRTRRSRRARPPTE